MTSGGMELDYEPAVRAAAGLTDVGTRVDAAARTLAAAVAELSWGNDEVGAALAARHDAGRHTVAAALPALAASLRQLDTTVQAGAATLVGTDRRSSAAVEGVSEGRV